MAARPDVTPGQDKVTIPASAKEITPGVFSLGQAMHNGKVVEGYAFVHYKDKKKFGKPAGTNDDGVCQGWEDPASNDCSSGGGEDPTDPDTSSCYGFLSKGAMWKNLEDYVVDPANNRGLDAGFVMGNIANDIDKWENAAGFNILGNGSVASGTLVADTKTPDNQNEVYFADIDTPGAIGVTIVWGIWGGPPPFRQIVEWDQVYDDVDYDWSATGEAGKMDFESIATHELGHSVGLGDLYDNKCSEQTMYGYAGNGEINKRTLEAGDIAGIQVLYR